MSAYEDMRSNNCNILLSCSAESNSNPQSPFYTDSSSCNLTHNSNSSLTNTNNNTNNNSNSNNNNKNRNEMITQSTPLPQTTYETKMNPYQMQRLHRNSSGNHFHNQSMINNNCIGSAKEYVESLHQNSKSQLVYGKNNVIVKQVSNKNNF